MSIMEFVEKEKKVSLTNFQKDLLSLLQQDPDAWQRKLKPSTHEMRQLFDIYSEWKERQNSLVAC